MYLQRRERLSGLALMSIHYEKPIDFAAAIQRFTEQKPQRMLLVDPICIIFCIYIYIPRRNTIIYCI